MGYYITTWSLLMVTYLIWGSHIFPLYILYTNVNDSYIDNILYAILLA